jgi:site-specific DNA-methyltransferase (adenine-specific)
MVRDLRGVIEREEAEMGVLVCLHSPTRNMTAEAAGAGFVKNSAHGRLPRLQIITIADMFAGKKPDFPPIPAPERIRARPQTQKESDQLELLLPFDRKAVRTAKGEFVDPRILKFGKSA